MAVLRVGRSWSRALLRRWLSIPLVTRVGISSKCWSSIRQRSWQGEWRCEGGLGGVGEGLGVAWVVAWREGFGDAVVGLTNLAGNP